MTQVNKKLPWDIFKGKIEIAEDFDDPLPEFEDYVDAEVSIFTFGPDQG